MIPLSPPSSVLAQFHGSQDMLEDPDEDASLFIGITDRREGETDSISHKIKSCKGEKQPAPYNEDIQALQCEEAQERHTIHDRTKTSDEEELQGFAARTVLNQPRMSLPVNRYGVFGSTHPTSAKCNRTGPSIDSITDAVVASGPITRSHGEKQQVKRRSALGSMIGKDTARLQKHQRRRTSRPQEPLRTTTPLEPKAAMPRKQRNSRRKYQTPMPDTPSFDTEITDGHTEGQTRVTESLLKAWVDIPRLIRREDYVKYD